MARQGSLDVFIMVMSSNYFCFHAGARKFSEETGLSGDVREFMDEHPEALSEYLRCVNWSLKMAQRYIIDIGISPPCNQRDVSCFMYRPVKRAFSSPSRLQPLPSTALTYLTPVKFANKRREKSALINSHRVDQ